MTDGHSTALGSAPSSRHFLWGPLGWVGAQAPLRERGHAARDGRGPSPPRVGVDAHSLSITWQECR